MISLALALVAGQAFAASPSASAKMIVMRGNEGVAVTDYPTLARCEAARATLIAIVTRFNDSHPPQQLPNGGVIVTSPYILSAVCLPE